MIDSHKSDDIIAALKQQPLDIREGVEEVFVDMWRHEENEKMVKICKRDAQKCC